VAKWKFGEVHRSGSFGVWSGETSLGQRAKVDDIATLKHHRNAIADIAEELAEMLEEVEGCCERAGHGFCEHKRIIKNLLDRFRVQEEKEQTMANMVCEAQTNNTEPIILHLANAIDALRAEVKALKQ